MGYFFYSFTRGILDFLKQVIYFLLTIIKYMLTEIGIMESEIKRGRGRPKLGNVLFARRLSPEKIKEVESLLSGAALRPLVDDAYKRGCEEDKNSHNIKALLDDVERLTKEVENLKDQLEKCARATDDQKAAYWRNRAIMAESSQRTNPYDQEAK